MDANEAERFRALVGADGLITVRLQQVAKELHIQLVVFHDQDGFCHPSLSLRKLLGTQQPNSPRQKDSGMIIQNKSDRLRKGKD
jgi:hypothetical protein